MKFTGALRTEFDHFARAVSDVVQTDVIITDADMNVVGSAFQYFSLYNDIKIGSLIAEVFYENRDVLIEHKRQKKSCRDCAEYSICKMESFVGVPIRMDSRTVGVIALILPRNTGRHLFDKIDSTVMFVRSMADLIASRIMESHTAHIIETKNKELMDILDASDAAMAYTDRYGGIQKESLQFANGSYITFDYLRNLCAEETLQEARALGANEGNVILINTDDNEINEMIAKAIHNESDRKLRDILIMHSSGLYQDYLQEYLFGEVGLLSHIHDGTIIINKPERIQILYQDRLAELIESQRNQEERARLIFCTDKDLQALSREGRFSERLYRQVARQSLRPERTIHTDAGVFRKYVRFMSGYYCRIYGKERWTQELDANECAALMGMEINALNSCIERAVRENTRLVGDGESTARLTSKEYERSRIAELIKEGRTQREICEMLAISRSTLNRRVAELRAEGYHL